MRYRLQLKQTAFRELQRLGRGTLSYERVRDAVRALAEDPRPRQSRKLSGGGSEWRRRVGDYPIVYAIDDDARTVTIFRIGHRKDIYRS